MYIYKNAVDFVVTHKMTNNTKLNLKRFEKKTNSWWNKPSYELELSGAH